MQTPEQEAEYYGRPLTAEDHRELDALHIAIQRLGIGNAEHAADTLEAFVHPDLRPEVRASATNWRELAHRLDDILHDAIALTVTGSPSGAARVQAIASAAATCREATR